ncbi:metalloendopeptidase [Plakobranchus ocellatus]|uniref:Metalloendopeptidase n=1 Tax=Plakobranchus ocellatus TaxID=259542 RepID=A0AAV4DP28_9GAST|nr:metalloendopeptidase [Plakobranchus ocellatus]
MVESINEDRANEEDNRMTASFDLQIEELPLNPAYNKTLPIFLATNSDLLELCKKLVIRGEYHAWYANLPCSNTPRDNAPEPAADDTDEEQTV